jgi:hypothetical protein
MSQDDILGCLPFMRKCTLQYDGSGVLAETLHPHSTRHASALLSASRMSVMLREHLDLRACVQLKCPSPHPFVPSPALPLFLRPPLASTQHDPGRFRFARSARCWICCIGILITTCRRFIRTILRLLADGGGAFTFSGYPDRGVQPRRQEARRLA